MITQTMLAVFKRDFLAFFGSLTGYVFVLAFILMTFGFAFRPWGSEFFVANKASLWLLTFGSGQFQPFPILVALFVPAVTMGSWASERQQGTDSLLLTLPAQDWELVVAKFMACFGVYSAALGFTLVYLAVLEVFGDPDLGLAFSTYLGYWLLGAAAIATAMLSSALTNNLTVAWILGALFCALLAAPDVTGRFFSDGMTTGGGLGVLSHFESFGKGVVALGDVLYFVGLTAAALYANAYVLGSRHWTTRRSRMVHGAVRLGAILVATVSLVSLGDRAAARADVTSERMLSLTSEATAVLEKLDSERPVFVQAWISPQVPEAYQETREGLINMLEEFDARGGSRLRVAIYSTELYSEEAERAETSFGIKPRRVETEADGRRSTEEIFLGLALTSGSREVTLPFFDKGLPIQYELTRAIGAVSQQKKPRVAVLGSGVDLFGGFDFQNMSRSEDWRVLEDLRKQYDVQKVEGTAAIGTAVAVVPLPSSLPQEPMDLLAKHLYDGGKALLLCDPFPEFDLTKAPTQPANANRNPFQQQRGPQKPPKGNIEGLLGAMGITWQKDQVVWDDYNPHPEWEIPPELVFVAPSRRPGEPSGFNEDDPITSGLQEVVLIFPGSLQWDPANSDITVTPLLWTGGRAGHHSWREMVQAGFLGMQRLPESSRTYESHVDVTVEAVSGDKKTVLDILSLSRAGRKAQTMSLDALPATLLFDVPERKALELREELTGKGARVSLAPHRRVLAARVQGYLRAPSDAHGMKKGELSSKPFEAIVVTDMDVVSNVFYALRAQGHTELSLDNVTFVANCIDSLAGEGSYITLRKLRPKHRTLTYFEEITREHEETQRKAVQAAKKEAEEQLEKAKGRFDEKVKAIEERTDLDRRTKLVMLESERRVEQSRLDMEEKRIQDTEQTKVRLSETEKTRKVRDAESGLILLAFMASTVLPIVLGVFVLLRKLVLERAAVDPTRRRS